MTTKLVRTVAIGWTVLCVVLGLATTWTVGQLRQAGDALDRAGSALSTTGDTIAGFDELPLVGDQIAETGSRISEQGERTSRLAKETRFRVTLVAILAGVLVAFLGSAPVILLWRVVETFDRRLRHLEAAGSATAAPDVPAS